MENNIPKSVQTAFERKAHPYFMWDGIQEISRGLEDILSEENRESILEAARALKDKKLIHFIGCGTSYFASIAATFAFHSLCGVQSTATNAFEFLAYPPPDLKNCALVGISHTGGTPAVVQSIDLVKKEGGTTIGFSDVASSALGRAAEWLVPSSLGTEPALPKTRSYTASLLRAYLLAVELARLEGRKVSQYTSILQNSPVMANSILQLLENQVRDLADKLPLPRKIVAVGGGPQWATANETALKLTEAALMDADAWELEEAVHGTWASTQPGDLIILFAMSGPSFAKCQKLATGMKTIGATVWAITNDKNGLADADHITYLPGDIPEILLPLFAILPLYQYTYFLALKRGIHPDNMNLIDPRYLEARMLMRESIS
jgi:glutamine---fructose-6-phosphate transaminase (isomerizing)